MLTFPRLRSILEWNWNSPEADSQILSFFALMLDFLLLVGRQFLGYNERIIRKKVVVSNWALKLLRMK